MSDTGLHRMPSEASAFCGSRQQLCPCRAPVPGALPVSAQPPALRQHRQGPVLQPGSLKPPKSCAVLLYQKEPGPICVKHRGTGCTTPAHSLGCESHRNIHPPGRNSNFSFYEKVSSTMWFSKIYNHYAMQIHRNASVLVINIGI